MAAWASRGVVATPHERASQAGLTVLQAGGNAVDAAVAAAATIAVVYPHMNGVGGDNFWLIYDARRGAVMALNGAGRSAASVELEAYRRRYGTSMPHRGGAAALTVPGAVSGWWAAHRYSADSMASTVAWSALLAEAVALAREGFPPSPGQRRVTAAASALFESSAPAEVQQTLWPIYHPDRLSGARFVQTELGATLDEVARDGAEVFYRGAVARRVARGAARHGSPLTESDFAEHRAEWVAPLRIRYRGGEAVSFPPPTQGFAALAILALLEDFDVGALDETDYVHIVVEATKLAFADRDRYLTDPALVDVPVDHCLDRGRLARRRTLISRRRVLPLEGPALEGDTIAIVVADAQGNAVSLIQSLYHEFGAGVVAGDTGVLLQNRGSFFALDPAHPNRLAPRKRTATTLIPSMYLVDGRPQFVYGTMGGEGQPQTQTALLTRLLHRGLDPSAAVAAPRWLLGRTWGERTRALRLEARFAPDVAPALRQRGHPVQIVEDWSDLMGHAQVIELGCQGLRGGSDPRADGAALAW